jgi:hypothetical protein
MSKIWTDKKGQTFEMKTEGGEWWYRKQGDLAWKKGKPPGFSQKPMRPLT